MSKKFSVIAVLFILSFFRIGTCSSVAPDDEFQFKKKIRHAPFVLHTIPKCGVHILHRLVHLLCPDELHTNNCFWTIPGERYYQKKIILRSHEGFSPEAFSIVAESRYKMLAIIRDPRDALISHAHYMRLWTDGSTRRDFFTVGVDFDSLSFDQQIKSLIIGDDYAESYVSYYKQLLG